MAEGDEQIPHFYLRTILVINWIMYACTYKADTYVWDITQKLGKVNNMWEPNVVRIFSTSATTYKEYTSK